MEDAYLDELGYFLEEGLWRYRHWGLGMSSSRSTTMVVCMLSTTTPDLGGCAQLAVCLMLVAVCQRHRNQARSPLHRDCFPLSVPSPVTTAIDIVDDGRNIESSLS